MRNQVEIVGVNIDNTTLEGAADSLKVFLEKDKLSMVFTPNSEILVDAVKEPYFTEVLNSGDLVIPDGIGVVIASKFYKKPIQERVTGYDLTCKLIEIAHKTNKSIYFLGGKKGVAEEAALNIIEKYEGIRILGYHDGYFDEEEEKLVLKNIGELKPDIIFVALGAPRQEKWIYENRDRLSAKIAMGVGGSIDVLANRVKRAPEFFRKYGLEWFYRLIKDPKRFFRVLKLPKFIILALYDAKLKLNKEENRG